MRLTRVSEDAKLILESDCTRVDHRETPGLQKIIHVAKSDILPAIIVEFGRDETVRSGIRKQWVVAIESEER